MLAFTLSVPCLLSTILKLPVILGVRQKFGEYFVKTGKIDKILAKHFTELFDKRNKGDYNDFYDYDEQTVLNLYPLSKNLIERIELLLTE